MCARLEIADDSGDIAAVLAVDVADDGGAERVLRVPDLPLRTPVAAHFSGAVMSAYCDPYDGPASREFLKMSVFQCLSGHLICSDCRPQINVCPICRAPLGSNR